MPHEAAPLRKALRVRGKIMRKIILSAVAATLIAASAPQAFAAQSRHPIRKETAASEQFRNAHNAVAQPSLPGWQYSGWSAPAGR
jgi:hypothetical protein